MSTAPDLALHLVPVTPAVAALLHQLQQEAIEANPAPEPGSVVLAATGAWVVPLDNNTDATCHRAYNAGWSASFYLYRHPLRPGIWTGEESRYDDQGRRWSRRITATTDDFGKLVEVAS